MKFSRLKKYWLSLLAVAFVSVCSVMAGCGSDSPKNSTAPSDSESEADSLSTATDSLVDLSGTYSLVGKCWKEFYRQESEVILFELDRNLNHTGREFTTKTLDENGTFQFTDVKLETPYVKIKLRGGASYSAEEYDSRFRQLDSVYAVVDMRKPDTVYLSTTSSAIAFRVARYVQGGVSLDSAMALAQKALVKGLFQDENLVENILIYEKRNDETMDGKFLQLFDFTMHYLDSCQQDTLIDSNGVWTLKSAMYNRAENALAVFAVGGDTIDIQLRRMTSDFFAGAEGMDRCTDKNVLDTALINIEESDRYHYAVVCDSNNVWNFMDQRDNDMLVMDAGYNGEIRIGPISKLRYAYDSVTGAWTFIHDTSLVCITTNIGKVFNYYGTYMRCDSTLSLATVTDMDYLTQELVCDSTLGAQTSKVDSTIRFVCSAGEFSLAPDSTLLEREAAANPCGEEEEFRKGVIDTTIYYHCYKGDMGVANAFDLAVGNACNVDHVGYVRYKNSFYYCNGFRWAYPTDSLNIDSIVDARDNQVYKTIGIESQVWLAENMNYAIDSSWCYNDSLENCEAYGRIYQWNEIAGSNPSVENICPEGWHMPSNAEWDTLTAFVDKWFTKRIQKVLGTTEGWYNGSYSSDGEDLIGFSAYPIGHRTLNGVYQERINSAFFCSSDASIENGEELSTMYVLHLKGMESSTVSPRLTCNVRCVKD